MRLPVADLERRLTEFQVVQDQNGQLVGAIGFQMEQRHGRIHSEAFSDFAMADTVRPSLWDRVHSLTVNHGIARLWTREDAPFWKRNGFQPASPEDIKKLPSAWAGTTSGWLTLQLKNEDTIVSLEKELAMFMEAEKQRTARAFRHARMLKVAATFLAVAFAIFVIVALFYLFRRNPGMLRIRH